MVFLLELLLGVLYSRYTPSVTQDEPSGDVWIWGSHPEQTVAGGAPRSLPSQGEVDPFFIFLRIPLDFRRGIIKSLFIFVYSGCV